jgi:hypothetical protein
MSDTSATTTTTSPSRSGQDPNLQILTINDFSPGIYQYSLNAGESGGLPLTYSPNAPLGSASNAVRCINKPGIGLIPFWHYNVMATQNLAGTVTGLGVQGPVLTYSSNQSQYAYGDGVYIGIQNVNDFYVCRWLPDNFVSNETPSYGLDETIYLAPTYGHSGLYPLFFTPSFGLNYSSPTTPVYTAMAVCLPYIGAAITMPGTASALYSTVSADYAYGTYTYNDRLLFFSSGFTGPYATTAAGLSSFSIGDSGFIGYTDPPLTYEVANTGGFPVYADFPVGEAYAYGAWGSMSTGELFLVKQGGGAIVVSGDIAAPSSAVYLPGVKGTGGMVQRATPTSIGLVYVTDTDGVWAWNGGNTSTKISSQIPDDACINPLLSGGYNDGALNYPNAIQAAVHHDVQNNIVFFANNWIYDVINNSWWKSEDTSIFNFAFFSRSLYYGNYMYCTIGGGGGGVPGGPLVPVNLYAFNAQSRAGSWEWTSNPIPVSVGNLVTISWVELVVSNPLETVATFTVTPQSASGQTPISVGNQPQSLTFTVPPLASAYRLSGRLGYTDYNIQFDIQAEGVVVAPILHQINIGYLDSAPTGPV